MNSRGCIVGGYTAWLALLITVYCTVPVLRAEAWGLIGLSGVTGIAAGAAALHSTMSGLTQPAARQRAEVSPVRPAMLMLSRLWDMAASHRRALGRERAVRQAGASLVSAVTVGQVADAVTDAANTLLGRCAAGGALLAVRSGGALRTVAPGTADPASATRQPAELAGWEPPPVTGTVPLLAPAARLPAAARAFVPGAGWMLLCPLGPEDRPPEDPLTGLLIVFGEQRVLAGLSATLEILAHQVALAVERITLRDKVASQGNQAYFRTLVQDTSDAILIVTGEGMVRYATPSAAGIFGAVTVEGAYLRELVAGPSSDDVERTFLQLRDFSGARPRYVDQRIIRHDGVPVQVQVRCSDLRDDPTVAGLVLTVRDVTEQRQLEEELRHQAFHDALTGLPNRVLFQDRIGQQLAAARRTGTTVGVLFVDLDDFKVVNDTMGHAVGDELIAAAAARLARVVRDSDTAARLGGDDFALLIGDAEDPAAVEAAADRVIAAFREPFPLASGMMLATVTVGVATTKDSADTDDLLRHADLALYAAKAAGKRQWRRYQPVLSTGLMKRRELQAALEDAVARSAFELAYQPIVTLATRELAGFEALVRWPHPRWGMMQPGQFIALAEETGLIVSLGSWVLAQAAGAIARWRRGPCQQGPCQEAPARKPYVSVNVSARQFSAPGFVDGVRQVLDTSGLEPGALMLELTESMLLRQDEQLQSDLRELKTIGVKLAIDDFGTGYSSLSYLRELPIDVVKMDKSFVDGIADCRQRLALAEGIVAIARTLQLEVVAEGIESEVQRELLTSMGCQSGQGYLLTKPMPASRAEALAQSRSGLVL